MIIAGEAEGEGEASAGSAGDAVGEGMTGIGLAAIGDWGNRAPPVGRDAGETALATHDAVPSPARIIIDTKRKPRKIT